MSRHDPDSALSDAGRQAVRLLTLYPALGPAERQALRSLSARLGARDVSHIWSDPRLSGRMLAFYEDHIDELSGPPRRFMVVIAAAAVLLGLLISLPGWLA